MFMAVSFQYIVIKMIRVSAWIVSLGLIVSLHATAQTAKETIWRYNAPGAERARILFDFYHHQRPSLSIGNLIVTGGWDTNVGRYGWDDISHTNGIDPLFGVLDRDYEIFILESRFTDKVLQGVDIVTILNPDSPILAPGVPVLDEAEIDAIERWVREGGNLMVIVNSTTRASEKFEDVKLRELVSRFGLDWDANDTHYTDIPIGPVHPFFYDISKFHYGAGCTLRVLKNAEMPEILLNVFSDPGYKDRNVQGPGIVQVRPGKGKVILVGDSGSFGGNLSRPWTDNVEFTKQLFAMIKPGAKVPAPAFKAGENRTYDFTMSGVTLGPNDNPITTVALPHHRMFTPKKYSGGPYIEVSGALDLSVKTISEAGAAELDARIHSLKYFDNEQLAQPHLVKMGASRQGKVYRVDSSTPDGQWIGADIAALVALIPNDAIKPGDRWETKERVRVPTVQNVDSPLLVDINTTYTYVRDEVINGVNCRLIRATGHYPIDLLGINATDIFPPEKFRRWMPPDVEWLNEGRKGGALLFKRDQWVEKETSRVIRARTQSRIMGWIREAGKPTDLTPAKRDTLMLTLTSHDAIFNYRSENP